MDELKVAAFYLEQLTVRTASAADQIGRIQIDESDKENKPSSYRRRKRIQRIKEKRERRESERHERLIPPWNYQKAQIWEKKCRRQRSLFIFHHPLTQRERM